MSGEFSGRSLDTHMRKSQNWRRVIGESELVHVGNHHDDTCDIDVGWKEITQ